MKKIVLILFALSILGCQKTLVEETKTAQTESVEAVATTEESKAIAGSFLAMIGGADSVKVQQVVIGEQTDSILLSHELTQKIIALVGPETMASDAVPKCIGKYRMTFLAGEKELASFNSICTDETAILSNGKVAFTAQDATGLISLIKEQTAK